MVLTMATSSAGAGSRLQAPQAASPQGRRRAGSKRQNTPRGAPGCSRSAAEHAELRAAAAQALEPLPAAGQRCAVGAALHALVARVDAPQAGFDSAHGLASRCALARALQALLARVPAVPCERSCACVGAGMTLPANTPCVGFEHTQATSPLGLNCTQRLQAGN